MERARSINRLTGIGPLTILMKPEGQLDEKLRRSLGSRPTPVLRPGMIDRKYARESFLYRGGVLLNEALLKRYSRPDETARVALLQKRIWLKAGEVRLSPGDATTIRFLLKTFLPRGQTIRIDDTTYTVADFHAPVIRTGPNAGESLELIPERIDGSDGSARYQVTITLALERGKTSPGALSFSAAACRRRKAAIDAEWDTLVREPKREERRQAMAARAEATRRRAVAAYAASPARSRRKVRSKSPPPPSSALTASHAAALKARARAERQRAQDKKKIGGRRKHPRRLSSRGRRSRRRRRTYSRICRRSRRKPAAKKAGMRLKSMRRRFRS